MSNFTDNELRKIAKMVRRPGRSSGLMYLIPTLMGGVGGFGGGVAGYLGGLPSSKERIEAIKGTPSLKTNLKYALESAGAQAGGIGLGGAAGAAFTLADQTRIRRAMKNIRKTNEDISEAGRKYDKVKSMAKGKGKGSKFHGNFSQEKRVYDKKMKKLLNRLKKQQKVLNKLRLPHSMRKLQNIGLGLGFAAGGLGTAIPTRAVYNRRNRKKLGNKK